MKKLLLIVVIIYVYIGNSFVLANALKLPKNISEISNKTKYLPKTVKIIALERDYDLSTDNNFFVLGDNSHIYEIDPYKREVIKDITIKGLNNPMGFSVARFFLKNKHEYEMYIADTDNNRIIKINLPMNTEPVIVEAESFLKINTGKPIDIKYYIRYTDEGKYKSSNIAVLTNDNKIKSYNLETQQLEKSIDITMKVNDDFIIPKNIPYYRETLLPNWGTGPQLRRYDYLESIKDHKNISSAHLSKDIGKISHSFYYVIPDNGNKLIWISYNSAHVGRNGKTIRDTMMQRTIKYTKEIDSVIRYGEHDDENLLVIVYKGVPGLSYNEVYDDAMSKVLDITETVGAVLTIPFMRHH